MKRSALIEKLIPYKSERNIELALEELGNPNTEDLSKDEIHNVWLRVSKALDRDFSDDDQHPLYKVEAQLAAEFDRKDPNLASLITLDNEDKEVQLVSGFGNGFIIALLIIITVCLIAFSITPIFSTQLGIDINHALITILPDSYDSIRFEKSNYEQMLTLHLFWANVSVLGAVVAYVNLYIYTILTYNVRTRVKTLLMVVGIYVVFYSTGLIANFATATNGA